MEAYVVAHLDLSGTGATWHGLVRQARLDIVIAWRLKARREMTRLAKVRQIWHRYG